MSPANRRTIRTVIQAVFGVAVALPGILAATGLDDALPWAAGAVAVSGVAARVMASTAAETFLDRFGLGLTDDNGGADA
jgi:hypothetical protein